MKLFLVETIAFSDKYYAVAEDPTSAYNKVRSYLDKKEYSSSDSELRHVTLVADDVDYPDCKRMLFL